VRKSLVTARTAGGSTGNSGRGGFWRGVAVGVAISVAIAAGLTLVFPPVTYAPPNLAPSALVPPDAPAHPATAPAAPPPPKYVGLLVPAPAPLLAELPATDLPPGLAALARPPAPDVFDGGAAGSPSLFRPATGPGASPTLR
jgi:hypothetical protein